MKIYLESGRTYVWQWTAAQRVILEGFPVGTVVRFSNCNTVEAPVVASYMDDDKMVAKIPPELMAVDKDITAYACNDTEVLHCSFISVISCAKPESYITEPVEVLRYETLHNRIPFDAAYEGQLLYVVGGVAMPLKLGPGLSIRDGVLQINIATSGDAVSINIDDDGILHVYQDGAEVIPVVDDAGDLTWPGLDLVIDDAGDATLQVKEE